MKINVGTILTIVFVAWVLFTICCAYYAYVKRKERGENPFTGKKKSR